MPTTSRSSARPDTGTVRGARRRLRRPGDHQHLGLYADHRAHRHARQPSAGSPARPVRLRQPDLHRPAAGLQPAGRLLPDLPAQLRPDRDHRHLRQPARRRVPRLSKRPGQICRSIAERPGSRLRRQRTARPHRRRDSRRGLHDRLRRGAQRQHPLHRGGRGLQPDHPQPDPQWQRGPALPGPGPGGGAERFERRRPEQPRQLGGQLQYGLRL